MVDETLEVCHQSGCSYQTSKICMDGIVSGCPNIVRVTKPNLNEDITEFNSTIEGSSVYHLPSNDELPEEMITEITNQYFCNLVLLVGEPECGKSTLYASLFDQFHKGGCGDYYFAGTKTPKGFERKCHEARVVSQNSSSKTERTKTKEFVYLQLSVRKKSLDVPIEHLLFADINGEKFQSARNSDEDMMSLRIFRSADHICFIVDGETLVDKGKWHTVKSDVFNMIKRAMQNNMLTQQKGFNLLITKWDKIQAANADSDVESFLIVPMKDKFGETIKQVLKIASRSENENIPAGTGVENFLKLALASPSIEMGTVTLKTSEKTSMREFQKFKYNR